MELIEVLIREGWAVNGTASSPIVQHDVTSLDHEVFHYSMHDAAVRRRVDESIALCVLQNACDTFDSATRYPSRQCRVV